MSNLLINNYDHSIEGDSDVLSADIDGYRVHFSFPNWLQMEDCGDLFLLAALLEGMFRGQAIEVSDSLPINTETKTNAERLMKIFACWNADLQPVEIIADETDSLPAKRGAACSFSGGVDSTYSFIKHRDAVENIVFIQGFDYGEREAEWSKILEKLTHFSKQNHVGIIPVRTNVREYADDHKISYNFQHGLTLVSVGLALGFESFIIPSSFTYRDMFPWGSHPLTDPMWSTSRTEIIHDSAELTRTQKIKRIIETPPFSDSLQVCWRYPSSNCGCCPKCVRTALAFHMYGESSVSVPQEGIENIHILKKMSVSSYPYVVDLIRLAEKSGYYNIQKTLRTYVRNYKVKYHVLEAMKILLPIRLLNYYRTRNRPNWADWRVIMEEKPY